MLPFFFRDMCATFPNLCLHALFMHRISVPSDNDEISKKMKKTILITGASSGIGKAPAIHFQQQGWNVVATMRTPEKETELRELDNVQLEKLDVLNPQSIDR